MAMMTVSSKHLPVDIITEILTRLPLKSLVRFRSLSKPWLHFLTNSSFPCWLFYHHLRCDSLNHCVQNETTVFLFYNTTSFRRQLPQTESSNSLCELYSLGGGLLEDSFRFAFELDFPLINGKSFQIMTGSCHGMLCLSIDADNTNTNNTLVVWNPSICEHRVLPLPDELGICAGVCGIGFDSSIDDYKLVSVYDKRVHIFSLKRNVWRNHPGELDYSLYDDAVSINGCLYWGASIGNKFADRILRLDLSDETFREVPLPFKPVLELNILLWGDSLCAYRQYDQTVWIMKQEKEANGGEVKETWTQIMTIPKIINHESRSRVRCYRLNPKCFTKSGKLVISLRRKRFVMFDGVKVQDLHVQGLGDGSFSKAIAYSESLISPRSIRGMNDID